MQASIEEVMRYHKASKHHFRKYARGPGYLDWASQPDPFRRYHGAALKMLERSVEGEEPFYEDAFDAGEIHAAPFDFQALSRLLRDCLSLSAWKRAGGESWALRVNPSSGNLHPTEGYVVVGPLPGLDEAPILCHYAPKEHALELRARLPLSLWEKLTAGLPQGAFFLGLSSIHRRESWKYGVRAYRYCMHDIGHALGAIGLAAAGVGLRARLWDSLSSDQLSNLLGIGDSGGADPESPDCLLAVYPAHSEDFPLRRLDPEIIQALKDGQLEGKPNRLSSSHLDWPDIEIVSEACEKPETSGMLVSSSLQGEYSRPDAKRSSIPLRQIIHQRRSAVAMDGVTAMDRDAFYAMLQRTLPGSGRIPFEILPWSPQIDLAIFVHRVKGLTPGLYFLFRSESRKEELQKSLKSSFAWKKPDDCPDPLDLYMLTSGDVRKASMQIACFQDIAGDGCFSVGMIAEFERPLNHYGAWFYPRLFWECGMIGQVLYLEAEAAGLRGTGIGCFFDDPMHELLGIESMRYQDLYHFTVGGHLEDPRLTTLPPY